MVPGTKGAIFRARCSYNGSGVSSEAGEEGEMKCGFCRKGKATVHITQNPMPGDTVRVNLCEKCARKHGLYDSDGFGLADLLLSARIRKGDSN